MRIVVNGQQAYGQAVLEALLERGEDVVGVYGAPDKEGQRPDPLKDYAVSKDVPVFQPASFKKKEVWDQMASLKPGLCVMAYVILLVPEEALAIPTHGTIQYHPSLLPKHRGPSSINWSIIQGEKKTGLSIFWPDKGLDTGPILLQKEVEITDEDTLGSVYFDKLFRLGVAAMMEAVDLVRAGNAPRLVQDETQATYESWCKKSDVEIDWSKSIDEVYNLIRGANPQPGAWTTLEGKKLEIFDCARLPDAGGAPGEITNVSSTGFNVAARGGQIQVKRVRPEGGKKVAASEFTASGDIASGTLLGS
ncbi:MAG: methionyl-tRNA formyltransferase [Proteobacteria bacterium]|nr:MAG: methionyl-tRNA formyltransferase [Pseudomonadota bacterium]TDJ71253.1 MAG: methionyl-tRNA formyltransferase [Pseudomonadota bacterium]